MEGSSDPALEHPRLQKYLARSGLGSRRRCEELIREGRVTLNGKVVDRMGVRLDPRRDQVAVDGIPVNTTEPLRYFMLNKPAGYVSTLQDPQGRPTIRDILPQGIRLFPVGRLDLDSRGLVLVTNDGHLANRIMHPRFGIDKGYVVVVEGKLDRYALRKLRSGVELEEGVTAPARVRHLGGGEGLEVLEIVIHQGWKRQVRRMCRAVGLEVRDLVRNRIGPLTLSDLPEGSWRELSSGEVEGLFRALGL
jgi:23S rRNA pseudouridine2605 synthase